MLLWWIVMVDCNQLTTRLFSYPVFPTEFLSSHRYLHRYLHPYLHPYLQPLLAVFRQLEIGRAHV